MCEQHLAYHMTCEIYTPYEGPDGMFAGKEWKIDNVEVKIITFLI